VVPEWRVHSTIARKRVLTSPGVRSGCDPALLDKSACSSTSWFDVEEHAAGKRLAREGASDYAFFVVDQGEVRVEQKGRMLAKVGPADVYGEMAFFADGRRNADVSAETDVRVLAMFGTRFREMQLSMEDVAARLEDVVRERSKAVPEG
jgi:CRP-like cAMP-binding protein